MSLAGHRIRRFVGSLLFVLTLAVAFGAALLTRFPDAALAERAADWPLVGGVVQAIRSRYLPVEGLSADGTATGSPNGEVPQPEAGAGEPERVVILGEARPTVWVDEGAILRAEPDDNAIPVATLDALTNLPLVERRGEWAWVDFRGVMGWVVPRPVVEGAPALGNRPTPVLPVAARPPDAAVLAAGLGQFARRPVELELGDYRLYTDWSGSQLLERCRQLEAGLEEVYRETFRLSPVGEPAEAVLLFSRRSDYEAFWRTADGREIGSVGHAGHGVVATFVGLRPPLEVCTTLIHELTHLLNRRAVGPALPPWLEEGMATEIATRHTGGAVEARLVRMAAREGRLPSISELLSLDRPRFHDPEMRRIHYEQSALWLRFLLQDPELGERLRAFLAYLARGGPYAPELEPGEMAAERETITLADDLAAFLGGDLEALDARFRTRLASD